MAEITETGASKRSTSAAMSPLGGEPDVEVEVRIKKSLADADLLKAEATEHFVAGEWTQAMALYQSALAHLPNRHHDEPREGSEAEDPETSEKSGGGGDGQASGEPSTLAGKASGPLSQSESKPESTRDPLPPNLAAECAKARSILNANMGACHVKLNEFKDAVDCCSEALLDDPTYVKALNRRASANEKIGSWSALASAEEDYATILKLLPASSPMRPQIMRAQQALAPNLEAAQKRETGEMVDKLKGLGNSVLGHFGLSTDNFKFEPNGGGGYSMNFAPSR